MWLGATRRNDSNDLDILFADRMCHDDDRKPECRPDRPPALLAILDPIDFKDDEGIIEDERSRGEVDPVLTKVGAVLLRIPLEPGVRTFVLLHGISLNK